LRGGYSRWKRQGFAQMAEVIGVTFLHALDLSEQAHAALHLRGYARRIPTSPRWRKLNRNDIAPLAFGISTFILSLAMNLEFRI
jgi:energy-coupling factor transporter transmembrane protein EcfT